MEQDFYSLMSFRAPTEGAVVMLNTLPPLDSLECRHVFLRFARLDPPRLVEAGSLLKADERYCFRRQPGVGRLASRRCFP